MVPCNTVYEQNIHKIGVKGGRREKETEKGIVEGKKRKKWSKRKQKRGRPQNRGQTCGRAGMQNEEDEKETTE